MSALPPSVDEEVRAVLRGKRLGSDIRDVHAMLGGCINRGVRIETDAGQKLFLKWNLEAPPDMFTAEADGLTALAATQTVRVPEPIACGGEKIVWLVMEYVKPGAMGPDAEVRLGRALAQLHATGQGVRFGWHRDNFIGSLPQTNARETSWSEFWTTRRIVPQLEAARTRGYASDRIFDRLIPMIPAALVDVTEPQLLHGDLWSGNCYAAEDGSPVLVDPAVYHGHGEVDLAMTELFGGFGPRFYAAYAEASGPQDAYEAYRRELYQLYYLLVHVNLFGPSYEPGAVRAAREVVSALSG